MVIGLILHGHSLKELDENIEKFRNKSILWGTINRIEPANNILKKIDKEVEFVVAYADQYKDKEFGCHKFTHSLCRGNSLTEFLFSSNEYGAKMVILFGADGYSDTNKPYYDDFKGFSLEPIEQHKRDTKRLNDWFKDIKMKMKIYNTSMESHYKPFKKVPLDEVLNYIPNKR